MSQQQKRQGSSPGHPMAKKNCAEDYWEDGIDDGDLTQPEFLAEIDRQIAKVSRRPEMTGPIVRAYEPIRSDAKFTVVGPPPDLAQEEIKRLKTEVETIKENYFIRQGEVKILRSQMSQLEKENMRLKTDLAQLRVDELKTREKTKEEIGKMEKRWRDQIAFLENDSRELAEKLDRAVKPSSTQTPTSVRQHQSEAVRRKQKDDGGAGSQFPSKRSFLAPPSHQSPVPDGVGARQTTEPPDVKLWRITGKLQELDLMNFYLSSHAATNAELVAILTEKTLLRAN